MLVQLSGEIAIRHPSLLPPSSPHSTLTCLFHRIALISPLTDPVPGYKSIRSLPTAEKYTIHTNSVWKTVLSRVHNVNKLCSWKGKGCVCYGWLADGGGGGGRVSLCHHHVNRCTHINVLTHGNYTSEIEGGGIYVIIVYK